MALFDPHNRFIFAVSICLLAWLSGCSGFYSQAARGQTEILVKRKNIDRVIANRRTDSELRDKLTIVQDIRRFADRRLALDVGRNYGSYADLDRDSVVWNVMASPEFSLWPKTWCYPIAGCVAYRGFFSQARTDRLAAELKAQGYDVYSGGVDAYSTLGYLRDPVLNTFVDRSDAGLAALLFHELAHAKFYLKGDTAFNEGFATAVEYAGLELWLKERGDDKIMQRFYEFDKATAVFRSLVRDTRQQLASLYAKDLDRTIMRVEKAAIIDGLRSRYQAAKPDLHGVSFDKWMNEEINNAKLNSVATYEDFVPGFTKILSRCNQDFDCFYRHVRILSKRPKAQRDSLLQRLGAGS